MHDVVVGFGSNEDMPINVVTEVGTHVPRKVVSRLIIGAAGETAIVATCVEPIALATNTGHDVAANFLLHPCAAVNGIEIVEDRTKPKVTERGSVRCLPETWRGLAAKPKVVMHPQQNVPAKADV